MGSKGKPFDPKSSIGLSLHWVAQKLQEGCYWWHTPQH